VTRLEDAAASFAAAMAALVQPDPDVADLLAQLVADCARATGSDTSALMALDGHGELSLLAADSHRAVELELLQIQRDSGPCVDVVRTGQSLHVAGADALRARWPRIGDAMVEAGFGAVEAYPMRWSGATLGGLNLFRAAADQPAAGAMAQAYADIATLVVARSIAIDDDHVRAQLHEALRARAIVEQAKGVLAYRDDVDLSAAYASLKRRARSSGAPLTQVASDVVSEASQGPTPTG
jgi:hypothetical protein